VAAISPSDLEIHSRNYAFGREQPPTRYWLNGDPVATAVFDALSATFPQGERFFMDSVRRFRNDTPPALQTQIAAFITQEAIHTREHLEFNRRLAEQGHDLVSVDERLKVLFDRAREAPDYMQLAITVALEHFTAILGHAILADPRYLAGADPEAARLWRWHALEEVEHKAVAFDTLDHILKAARTPPHKRWLLRSLVMLSATGDFLKMLRINAVQFLAEDGMTPADAWRAVFKYLVVSPGIMIRILPRYLSIYLPGFHPWRHDDRALMRRAEAELGSAGASA